MGMKRKRMTIIITNNANAIVNQSKSALGWVFVGLLEVSPR